MGRERLAVGDSFWRRSTIGETADTAWRRLLLGNDACAERFQFSDERSGSIRIHSASIELRRGGAQQSQATRSASRRWRIDYRLENVARRRGYTLHGVSWQQRR